MENDKKIDFELAKEEVNKWLDYKKVGPSKREDKKSFIDNLANSISDGDLVLNTDFTFTQKLKFPIESETTILSLNYRARLDGVTLFSHLKGVDSSDFDGRIIAHAAALTSKPKQYIKSLDTEDLSVAQAIAFFFM